MKLGCCVISILRRYHFLFQVIVITPFQHPVSRYGRHFYIAIILVIIIVRIVIVGVCVVTAIVVLVIAGVINAVVVIVIDFTFSAVLSSLRRLGSGLKSFSLMVQSFGGTHCNASLRANACTCACAPSTRFSLSPPARARILDTCTLYRISWHDVHAIASSRTSCRVSV